MQGNSNQQQQTPLPTTCAALRQRTQQVLGFDENGQLTDLDVAIPLPRLAPVPGSDNNARVASDITYYAYAVKQGNTKQYLGTVCAYR
ncbi:hypothetical protein CAEBREN_22694 [Caenorhabditis brenneri]|uniref:Uncharacterized protein n=1 Tax=Caenorhabditis brenneri TaxID=135651 RepID=G0MB61_CAEBE|nr:hypothetical protein CAEBREN_22694 [Caenorhabditis brenneri]